MCIITLPPSHSVTSRTEKLQTIPRSSCPFLPYTGAGAREGVNVRHQHLQTAKLSCETGMINPYIPSQRYSLFPPKDNPESVSSVLMLRAACLAVAASTVHVRFSLANDWLLWSLWSQFRHSLPGPRSAVPSQGFPWAVTDCTMLPHEAFWPAS